MIIVVIIIIIIFIIIIIIIIIIITIITLLYFPERILGIAKNTASALLSDVSYSSSAGFIDSSFCFKRILSYSVS